MNPFSNRFCQGSGDSPAVSVNPHIERAVTDSGCLRPFSHVEGFAAECKKPVLAAVKSLLPPRGPSTILWGVIAIVILSVNAVQWARALTHVFQEPCKRLSPTTTYLYTPASIPCVAAVLGILTPPNDVAPSFVSLGFCHAVRDAFCVSKLNALAPATFTAARGEPRATVRSFIAANTPAEILPVASLYKRWSDESCKEPEFLARFNDEYFHASSLVKREVLVKGY